MDAKKSNTMRRLLADRTSSSELVEAIRRSAVDSGKVFTIEIEGERYVVKRDKPKKLRRTAKSGVLEPH